MEFIEHTITDGLAFGLPLFIIAAGGIFSEKSGVTNLALEGFQGFGAFCGALVATLVSEFMGLSSTLVIVLSILAAMIGGALFAGIHALLCIKYRSNQVISGVVINILAVALTTFLTTQVNSSLQGNASNKFTLDVLPRFTVPGISEVPILGAFFTDIYPYEILILILAAVVFYVMYYTRFGMHLRACGENPQSLDAAGGNVIRVRYRAVFLSGALSGIGGICIAYSILSMFSPSIYMGFGYLAIAAMIFGNWEVLPTLLVCIFFGMARAGGYQLCLKMGLASIYTDLFMILPYVLTLFLLVFFSKKNHPPKAAGEPYDQGKR